MLHPGWLAVCDPAKKIGLGGKAVKMASIFGLLGGVSATPPPPSPSVLSAPLSLTSPIGYSGAPTRTRERTPALYRSLLNNC